MPQLMGVDFVHVLKGLILHRKVIINIGEVHPVTKLLGTEVQVLVGDILSLENEVEHLLQDMQGDFLGNMVDNLLASRLLGTCRGNGCCGGFSGGGGGGGLFVVVMVVMMVGLSSEHHSTQDGQQDQELRHIARRTCQNLVWD